MMKKIDVINFKNQIIISNSFSIMLVLAYEIRIDMKMSEYFLPSKNYYPKHKS